MICDIEADGWQQGKTTTTERMLYYSGFSRRLGGMLLKSLALGSSYMIWKFDSMSNPI